MHSPAATQKQPFHPDSRKNQLTGSLPRTVPRSGLLPQDDVLFHNLTVTETFEFAAAICLPGSVPAAAKRQLASRVISELGLAKVANTFVGVSHGMSPRRHVVSGRCWYGKCLQGVVQLGMWRELCCLELNGEGEDMRTYGGCSLCWVFPAKHESYSTVLSNRRLTCTRIACQNDKNGTTSPDSIIVNAILLLPCCLFRCQIPSVARKPGRLLLQNSFVRGISGGERKRLQHRHSDPAQPVPDILR